MASEGTVIRFPRGEEEDELLTVAEAARLLKVSIPKAYELARAGAIPTWRPKFSERIIRIPRRALLDRIAKETYVA